MSFNNNLLGDAEQGSQYSRYSSSDDYLGSYQANNRSLGQSAGDFCSNLTTKAKSNKKILIGIGATIAAILLIIIIVVASKHESNPTQPPEPWLDFHLPKTVIPITQRVDLHVDLERNSYTGYTAISLNITESTNVIILHSEIVSFLRVNVSDANDRVIDNSFFHYPANDFVVIKLTEFLPVSIGAHVNISFESMLDGDMRGLYNSSYKTTTGQSIKMAVTQFEATDARRAFPCFDEPAMKAQFTINVEAPWTSPTTLSNMNELRRINFTVNNEAWYRAEFDQSLKMSSYLVAVTISDWAKVCSAEKFKGNKDFCVWASPEKIANHLGDEAVMVGVTQINKFADYFAVDFPLPKMDMVTIDLSASAMENWGLITYRETALMYNPARNTEAERQSIARVIAHELAHQWFGDSTSPKTWADLWLNEGFASWVQYLGLDAVFEDWQSQQQFLTDTAAAAYALDSLPVPATHPIVDPSAQTPAQISALFDSISYNKGACLIRMMASFLTKDIFQDGLRRYLKQYEYSNADSSDLMTVLTAAAAGTPNAVNVNEVMDSYLTKAGYPLLTVSFQNNSGVLHVFVTQSRYLSPPNSPVDTSVQWHIPISWCVSTGNSKSESNQTFWLPADSSTHELPFVFSPVGNDLWFKLNTDQGFFYRVMYPLEHWDILAKYMSTAEFSIEDRTGLIMDGFALARSGQLDWPRALSLLLYFGGPAGEHDLTPITAVLTEIDRLAPYFPRGTDNWIAFKTFCHTLLGDLYISQPDPDSPPAPPVNHLQMMIWQRVFAASAKYEVEGAADVAQQQFQRAQTANDPFVVHPEIASTVFTVGMRMSGRTDSWDWVEQLYASSADAAASNRYLASMASIQNERQLNLLLEYAFNGVVKPGDTAAVLAAVCNTDWTLFDTYMRNNFDKVTSFFKSGYSGLGRVIDAWVGSIRDADRLGSVQAFMTTDRVAKLAAAQSAYSAAVVNAQNNIQFKTNSLPAILDWIHWFNQQNL